MDLDAEDPLELACGHVFGTACIEKWARNNGTCPMCRADVVAKNVFEEYEGELDRLQASTAWLQEFVGRDSHVEESSWYDDAFDPSFDGRKSETESDGSENLLNGHVDLITSGQVNHHLGEDIWITALQDQPTLFSPFKLRFHPYNEKTHDVDSLERFEELRHSHEKWMNESLEDEESDEEDPIGYFDVFPH
jgi:hypothetical protein|tara:strand:+ start:11422 stop:11997 length:576 start_codon:yes stop_codon:yes gene_type:complete